VAFTRALVRPPAETFATGITSSALGPPDIGLARSQHDEYSRTLERLGVALIRLAPEPAFPDGTFVEDAAIVTSRGAILARPGAPSRAGEVDGIRAALEPWFAGLEQIAAPGTLDGGDVCEAGSHFFIGRSQRTNDEGAVQLGAWLAKRGFCSSVIDIRSLPRLLHLKTGLSWLGGQRLLAASELVAHEALAGWEIVPVPDEEAYAANAILVNDTVLLADGFPATAARVRRLGYEVQCLAMSEYRKMDGALSCLSLRW
jgi:dimethylargininase